MQRQKTSANFFIENKVFLSSFGGGAPGAGSEGCVNALCPPRAAVETAVRTAPRPPAGVSRQKRFSTTPRE